MTPDAMSESTTKPQRSYVRRQLTSIQKSREMALTLLGVDKRAIAKATGSTETVIFNIFADKHRSPETEAKVLEFLNDRTALIGPWDQKQLRTLGFRRVGTSEVGIEFTPENFGWPEPE
jgi:hypothetical protein